MDKYKYGRRPRCTKIPVLTSRKYNRIVERNNVKHNNTHPYEGYEEAGMLDLVSVLQLCHHYKLRDTMQLVFGIHLTKLMNLIDARSMRIIQRHPVVDDYRSHLYPKFLVEAAIRTAHEDCPYQYDYSSRQVVVSGDAELEDGDAELHYAELYDGDDELYDGLAEFYSAELENIEIYGEEICDGLSGLAESYDADAELYYAELEDVEDVEICDGIGYADTRYEQWDELRISSDYKQYILEYLKVLNNI